MKKNKVVLLIVVIFLLCSLVFIYLDRDKNYQNSSDSNYVDDDNAIYFYKYKDKVYYIDNNITTSKVTNGNYKYCLETDPRAYTDFRDYYLFKNTLLVSGKYLTKYKCLTDECFVVSHDENSSVLDMKGLFKNGSVIIFDGIERNIIIE